MYNNQKEGIYSLMLSLIFVIGNLKSKINKEKHKSSVLTPDVLRLCQWRAAPGAQDGVRHLSPVDQGSAVPVQVVGLVAEGRVAVQVPRGPVQASLLGVRLVRVVKVKVGRRGHNHL